MTCNESLVEHVTVRRVSYEDGGFFALTVCLASAVIRILTDDDDIHIPQQGMHMFPTINACRMLVTLKSTIYE
jgi:hypothetical protein